MTVAASYTFQRRTIQTLTWTVTDPAGAGIAGADVTATLYADRSTLRPAATPGTPCAAFSGLVLAPTATAGVYQTQIPAAFDPPQSESFVLVVDAIDHATLIPLRHWEVRAFVGDDSSIVDLTTVAAVKAWGQIGQQNTSEDGIIQAAISGFSQWVLNYTDRGSLNSVVQYSETYDGNGNMEMVLRNAPIRSLISVTASGSTMPLSTNGSPGVFVRDNGFSIAIRGGIGVTAQPTFTTVATRAHGPGFPRGIGNVVVVYTAGYQFVPADLEEAVKKAVSVNYKRRAWEDLASKAISADGGTGTTTYRNWALAPDVMNTLRMYRRGTFS